MIVQCPSCASRYRVNDANVPASGGKITCPSCQHKFIVYPEEQNPAPSAPASDDLEDKTSVAFRPDLNKLVNQMQQGGGAPQGGADDGVAATEVMSGDSIPDFLNGADMPDDGTVEMKNPFEDGGLPGMGQGNAGGHQDSPMDEGAPTEVVSGDMLDNFGFNDSSAESKPPFEPADAPQAPSPPQPQQTQQPAPAQPSQPAQQPSQQQSQQQSQQDAGGQAAPFEAADGPSGPNADHDGPWKLKTNFGLTYEFPDTKSLKNWLSNREDLDGYELSGDGDTFHALSAWPQISSGPAQSGPQQPPSFQQNNPSPPPQQPPSGPGAGAAGMPGNSLASQTPAPSAPVPSPSSEPPGKKIKPKEYRPPSRDGKWNVLLWGVVLVLLLVAGGLSVQMFGIYDIKGEVLGMKSTQPEEQAQKPAPQEQAAPANEAQQEEVAQEESGPNPKLVKEVNRLIDDAERAVKNNRLQTAAEKLQNAKLLTPERVEIYEMLAEVYAEMGQDKEAEAAKKKVAELTASEDPGDEAGEAASNE
jgi:predicted Zn finger-like uncharacterized protein